MLKKTTKSKPNKGKKETSTKGESKQATRTQEPTVEEKKAESNTPKGLPLFFENPQALDKERHEHAGVKQVENYSFTKSTNSIPLNAIEFIEAVKSFPIVFTLDDAPSPLAVVGLKQSNYFVEANGKWDSRSYIPAYVRQYPFVFFEHTEKEKFFLCIDESSESYNEKATSDDTPLFKDGEASPVTNNALEFCTAFYNHHQITKNLCEDLKKHDLLVPYHSEIQMNSGEKINLAGFSMIDEQRFNKLSDEVILEFRQKGWLAFIYLALTSSSNWKNLVDLAAVKEDSASSGSKKVSNIKEA